MFVKLKILFSFLALFQLNCSNFSSGQAINTSKLDKISRFSPEAGAVRMEKYLPALQQSSGVALVVNQTSMVGAVHLVDTLLRSGVAIKKIFAPEHGFRGQADAGEKIKDGIDTQTGVPLLSLYGKNKKPSKEQLDGIEWVVFDIQDVGARFYTYISTMHYVMEACAENDVSFMVLDRPNPNGHYVDGPVLDPSYASFVGMHPVPIVHGMTVGEYAQMINGEFWLKDSLQAALSVVPCANYSHRSPYELPVPPSPNLPNMRAIYLYPSLCLFEGTTCSVGRGTNKQFQVYGHPEAQIGDYYFTPKPMPGAKYPKHEGTACRGIDLTGQDENRLRNKGYLDLSYLIDFYQAFPDSSSFFLKNRFFDKLAGTHLLREQILAGKTASEIRQSWQKGLSEFKAIRLKYLMYEE
jgi:uncharacterized protein YbbC (DUF1343 family)